MENQNITKLKVARYMKELLPIHNNLDDERDRIKDLEFSKVTLFFSKKNICKEVSFYYLLTHNKVSFVKYILAEEIIRISLGLSSLYKSIYDLCADVFVIDLSAFTKNKRAFEYINMFIKYATNLDNNICVILFYNGSKFSFEKKYSSSDMTEKLYYEQCVDLNNSEAAVVENDQSEYNTNSSNNNEDGETFIDYINNF